MGLHEKIYNALVRKNENVQKEYEKYVMSHIEEHYENRFKHWKILWKLNWHYRVRKKENPLLYFEQVVGLKQLPSKKKRKYKIESESESFKRTYAHHIVKRYLEKDNIVFSLFDVLLLRPFLDSTEIFLLMQEELGQRNFADIRIKAEKKVRERALVERGNQEVTIYDIWNEVEKISGISAQKGVELEFFLEKELCFVNPYFKRVWDILKSYEKKVYILADTYYSQSMIKELLTLKGLKGIEGVIVSCEYNCNKKTDGELFKILLRNMENQTLIYIGDDKDISKAKKYNIETHFYKDVNTVGRKYRVSGMSKLIGSGYSGIVNAKLHSGLKRYNIYYEHGYVYGGIYILGFVNYIKNYYEIYNAEKIVFLSSVGEICSKVFKEINQLIPIETVCWSETASEILLSQYDRNTFVEKLVWKNIKNHITIYELFTSAKLEGLLNYLKDYKLHPDEYLYEGNGVVVQQLLYDNYKDVEISMNNLKENLKIYLSSIVKECKKVILVDITDDTNGVDKLAELMMNEWKICDDIKCIIAQSSTWNTSITTSSDVQATIQTYLFNRAYNRSEFKSYIAIDKEKRDFLFGLFTQSLSSDMEYISSEGKFVCSVPKVENYYVINQIQKGIVDFVKDYVKAFGKHRIMMNIAGYDAYMPMKKLFKDMKYFEKVFSEFVYDSTIFPDSKGRGMKKIINIID